MSYKNFQVVKQIVLPFVNSIDMTYAEYQEEYGIDLSTLDLYDKIYVKGEDKVAVPVLAVDKTNKVLYTADKAFSYDDEFKELSDSLVKEIVDDLPPSGSKLYKHVVNFSGYSLTFISNISIAFTNMYDIVNAFNNGSVESDGKFILRVSTYFSTSGGTAYPYPFINNEYPVVRSQLKYLAVKSGPGSALIMKIRNADSLIADTGTGEVTITQGSTTEGSTFDFTSDTVTLL